jgi:transposase-like protein
MRKGGAFIDQKKEADKKAARNWEEEYEEVVDSYCPHCKSKNSTEKETTVTFEYGIPTEATLTAEVPFLECNDCKFSWCDRRTEQAREAAVDEYLRTKEK